MPTTLSPFRHLRWPELAAFPDDFWTTSLAQEEIRVNEYVDSGQYVVRAALPGVDPQKDISVSVRDGVLMIQAERRKESKVAEKDYYREELRYGKFSRSIPLPRGVHEKEVEAKYDNGVLEVRLPGGEGAPQAIPIAIAKSR